MSIEHSLIFSLLLPFATALCLFGISSKWRGALLLIMTSAILLSTGSLAFEIHASSALHYSISGWAPPLGIALNVDGLAVIMMLLTALISAAVITYSYAYFREEARGFWPLMYFLWGSLNTLFLVADLFTIYVCLELITLAAVAMITLSKNLSALKAAQKYLMTALMGSLAYLLGVGLIYAQTGSLDWTLVHEKMDSAAVGWAALSLMTMGLAIKVALFPLHFWLPEAHSVAPAPVSALLSALVVKASFYLLLRLWIQVLPQASSLEASHVLGTLGAGAIVWGSFQAIIQTRIKLMVAYSTVAQLGYLFLCFPLLSAAAATGDIAAQTDIWNGAIYFALSHAVAKAALFLAAGVLLKATGSDQIEDLKGAVAYSPGAILTWGLAGISLIGLPPSGGFIGKWQLLSGAIRFGQWPYAAVILFGGLLASAYVFRVLWYAFLTRKSHKEIQPVPILMSGAAIFLGLSIIFMGVRTTEFFTIARVASPFLNGASP